VRGVLRPSPGTEAGVDNATVSRPNSRDSPKLSTTVKKTTGARLTQILLACGALYAVLYVVVNDVVAAGLYEGYDPVSQAVSELSATGSPAKVFLTTIFPVWLALMVAFGIGVRRAAGRRRALRVTGNLLVAHGIVALLWLAFPMTSRTDITAGAPAATNDVGHIVMFGTLTGIQARNVAIGEPTPWMGLAERLSIAPWLLWMAVLAVMLMTARYAGPAAPVLGVGGSHAVTDDHS